MSSNKNEGKKRLAFHPREMSSQYAHSEYQFIQDKNKQQINVDELPKVASTPMH